MARGGLRDVVVVDSEKVISLMILLDNKSFIVIGDDGTVVPDISQKTETKIVYCSTLVFLKA